MITYKDELLMHHGIKGQKWGVRRYQNSDGSLTAAGKKRYGSDAAKKRNPVSEIVQNISRRTSASAKEKSANKAVAEAKKAEESMRKEKAALEKAKLELEAERKKLLEYKEAPEYKEKLQKETEMAKLSNEALAAKIRAIDLERQYEALVNPKPMTKAKKTALEKTKEVVSLMRDVTTLTLGVGKVVSGFASAMNEDKKKG